MARSFSDRSQSLQDLITKRVRTELLDDVEQLADQHSAGLAERVYKDVTLTVRQDFEAKLLDSCKSVTDQVPTIVCKDVMPKILPIMVEEAVSQLTTIDASRVVNQTSAEDLRNGPPASSDAPSRRANDRA